LCIRLQEGASIELKIAGCQGSNRKTLELRKYLYEMYGLTGAASHWQKREQEEFVGNFMCAKVSGAPDVDSRAQNIQCLVEDVNRFRSR
jgi:hypothetical protein